jgi:hypothetical protein
MKGEVTRKQGLEKMVKAMLENPEYKLLHSQTKLT